MKNSQKLAALTVLVGVSLTGCAGGPDAQSDGADQDSAEQETFSPLDGDGHQAVGEHLSKYAYELAEEEGWSDADWTLDYIDSYYDDEETHITHTEFLVENSELSYDAEDIEAMVCELADTSAERLSGGDIEAENLTNMVVGTKVSFASEEYGSAFGYITKSSETAYEFEGGEIHSNCEDGQ